MRKEKSSIMSLNLLELLINTKCTFYVYDGNSDKWKAAKANETAQIYPGLCFGKSIYRGHLKNGKPNGFGTLYYTSPSGGRSTKYSGYWKDGELHGAGRVVAEYSSHTYTYTGMFKNGEKHGLGSEHYLFGSYKGLFKNDEQYSRTE